LEELTPAQVRERDLIGLQMIERVEELLLMFPQTPVPEHTHIENGIFYKSIFIPAGCIAVGHAHTEPFFEAVMKGSMIMYAPFQEPAIIEAPYIGTGKPHKRKVGYALEDTIWATFHHSHEEDAEAAEEALIIKSETWKRIMGETK